MKIILEEKDLKYIENVNKDLAEGINDIPLLINQTGRDYYINFSCNDIAKGNDFVMMFMNKSNRKQLEELFDVEINSLNYCHGDDKLAEIKSILQQTIEKLDHM